MWTGKVKYFFILLFFVICGILGYFILQKNNISSGEKNQNVVYMYDTDPQNDAFIKGRLTRQQMQILDKILMLEKKQNGMKCAPADVNQISRYDKELIEAYQRWTNCKNMRRSYHHVLYPNERKNQ